MAVLHSHPAFCILLWAGEGLAISHTVTGADDVIKNDKLGESKGIALAQVVANVEEAKLVEAVRAQVAILSHVRPDAVFQFAGLLVAEARVDLQHAARPVVIFFPKEA